MKGNIMQSNAEKGWLKECKGREGKGSESARNVKCTCRSTEMSNAGENAKNVVPPSCRLF